MTRRLLSVTASIGAACAGAAMLLSCASGGESARPAASGPAAGQAVAKADALAEPAVSGSTPSLRLMSQSEYLHTVTDIFGPDIAVNVRFAPVKRTEGLLSVGAGAAVVTPGAMDRLESAARSVAQQVTDPKHRGVLIGCKPASETAADEACARQFLGKVGRLLYRRPLTKDELDLKVKVAGQAADNGGGFYKGLYYGLSGLLTSPNFLLIAEDIEPDPRHPGGWRLDGYSKAARLSFLLWDSAPDSELLRAAERGELHDAKGLRRQTERMLAAPQYEQAVRAFFEDFLVLEAFDNVAKDPIIYPAYSSGMAKEAREQVLRTVVDHLVTRKGDYRDLFTTRRTMMSPGLAPLYRAPVAPGADGWAPYEFPAGDPRMGLLTQVGFLSQYAHPGRSSSTRRGRGIREVLLCQKVPDPPPNVDFSIIEDPKAKYRTARERLEAHNADPVCAGCHKIMDPIGLALEQFDGAGQFRRTEHGATIDPSGSLDGVAYSDAAGLAQALHDSPSVRACIVNRLYAYGVGRAATKEERPLLRYFQASLDKTGYRFDDLLRVVIYSDAFFAAKPPTDNPVRKTAQLN